jgi:hypothetical protein
MITAQFANDVAHKKAKAPQRQFLYEETIEERILVDAKKGLTETRLPAGLVEYEKGLIKHMKEKGFTLTLDEPYSYLVTW